MPSVKATLRLRATPAPSKGVGVALPAAGLAGPYATQVRQPFPTGDGTTWVFGLYGLAESDEVEWDVTLGDFDYVPDEMRDRHTLLVVFQARPGGSVTATANGNVIGSASYGAAPA